MSSAIKKAANLAAVAFCLFAFSLNNAARMAVAEEAPKSIPFAVSPIFPQNQNPKTKGYFDLNVKANQEQTIHFKVTNNRSSEINLVLEAANALTSSSGGVQYVNASSEENKNLLDSAYAFANAAKVANEVKIAPKGTADVAVLIKAPNFSEGTILGGVIFSEKDAVQTQESQSQNNVSLQIKNRVNFTMAVQLEFPAKKEPLIGAGEVSVAYWPAGPQLLVPIKNEAAALAENVTGSFRVADENGNEIFKGKFNNMSMAPKTKIEYPLPWNNERIAPGKYKAELTLQIGATKIETAKPFEITKSQTVQYQSETIKKPTAEVSEESSFPMWAIWAIGVLLALVILFLARKAFSERN